MVPAYNECACVCVCAHPRPNINLVFHTHSVCTVLLLPLLPFPFSFNWPFPELFRVGLGWVHQKETCGIYFSRFLQTWCLLVTAPAVTVHCVNLCMFHTDIKTFICSMRRVATMLLIVSCCPQTKLEDDLLQPQWDGLTMLPESGKTAYDLRMFTIIAALKNYYICHLSHWPFCNIKVKVCMLTERLTGQRRGVWDWDREEAVYWDGKESTNVIFCC